MPAEWADVSAAGLWRESPLGGKDHPVSRPVQEGWGTSRNCGRQAGCSVVGKTPDLWGEGDERESEEEQGGGAQEWVQLVQGYNFYRQSARGKGCLCQRDNETGCPQRQSVDREGFVL